MRGGICLHLDAGDGAVFIRHARSAVKDFARLLFERNARNALRVRLGGLDDRAQGLQVGPGITRVVCSRALDGHHGIVIHVFGHGHVNGRGRGVLDDEGDGLGFEPGLRRLAVILGCRAQVDHGALFEREGRSTDVCHAGLGLIIELRDERSVFADNDAPKFNGCDIRRVLFFAGCPCLDAQLRTVLDGDVPDLDLACAVHLNLCLSR